MTQARRLLADSGPHTSSADATLPAVVRELFAALPVAAPAGAQGIRTLLATIVATDAAVRRGFESAVADVTKDTMSDGAAAHRTVDRPGLQAYLRARFPRAPDLTVRSVNAIPGGHSKETILFEIEPHPDWPAAMVIRMDAGRYGTSVTQEFPLLVALAREHIPVPTPLWVETDASVFGGAFMVTRRMPGAPPGTLWDVSGVSARRAPSSPQRSAVCTRCRCDRSASTAPQRRSRSCRRCSRRVRSAGVRACRSLPWRWKPRTAGCGSSRRRVDVSACLVHGDPGLQNVLVEDGSLQCLLDWEFAHASDPAEDLAYCRPAIEKVMPWPEFVAAYRAAGGGDVTEERLQFFEVWRCLRNASLAANVLHDVQRGVLQGLEMAAIAVNTYPRLEAQLAASLTRVLAT